jgi:predicted AAA+ superfamily ATPase
LLVKTKLADSHRYVSLEPTDLRAFALEDPRGFLQRNPAPVIFDEIQHAPDLLSFIKDIIDEDRDRAGAFVLTGSRNFPLMQGVAQSLAGRARVLELLPLALSENPGSRVEAVGSSESAAEWWVCGSYPEIHRKIAMEPRSWHNAYLNTYLEMDVRKILNVGDLNAFNQVLRVLATQAGGLLNLSSVSTDTGVAVNTVKSWISVLQASYQIFLLPPFHRSVRKRLVRAPKVYFTDCGTLSNLLGMLTPGQAISDSRAGAFFENMVAGELLRIFANSGERPALYFWRTTSHEEVDLVFEWGGRIHAFECKHSLSPSPAHAKGLKALAAEFGGSELGRLRIVCLCPESLAGEAGLGGIELLPLSRLSRMRTMDDLLA